MRSNKMMMTAMSFAVALVLGTAAFAQTPAPTAPAGGPPPEGRNPAAHAAHEACKASVAKDAQGHPDHKAMRACMQAKGFNPPEHGEHGEHGGGGGMPPMGAGGQPPAAN